MKQDRPQEPWNNFTQLKISKSGFAIYKIAQVLQNTFFDASSDELNKDKLYNLEPGCPVGNTITNSLFFYEPRETKDRGVQNKHNLVSYEWKETHAITKSQW